VVLTGLFFPERLLGILAPGFPPTLVAQARNLIQLTSVGFAVLTLVGSISAVLNFYHVFWGQPFGQLFLNTLLAVGIMALGGKMLTFENQFNLLSVLVFFGLVGILLTMLVLYMRIWRAHMKSCVQTWAQSLRMSLLLILPQILTLVAEAWKPIAVNQSLSHLDTGSVAIYTFSIRLLMLGVLLPMALITILFPNLSRVWGDGRYKRLWRMAWRATFLLGGGAAILACGLYFSAHWWMSWLAWLSNMQMNRFEELLATYCLLVVMTPFYILNLFYTQLAFACHMRKTVVLVALITLAALLVALNLYGHSMVAIAWSYGGMLFIGGAMQGTLVFRTIYAACNRSN